MPSVRCRTCNQDKPRTDQFWHREKTAADGFRFTCKVCRNDYRATIHEKERLDPAFRERKRLAANEWYAANTERASERQRQYYAEPGVAARQQARAKERRATDPAFVEATAKRGRAWFEANRERQKENYRKWRARNPERAKALDASLNAARRARLKAAPGRYGVKDVSAKLVEQGYRCFWCSDEVSGGRHTIDHYIPLNRGGSNFPDNIVIACATCNYTRRDRLPDEFLAILQGSAPA